MRLELDRLDIHAGDFVRPLEVEVDDSLALSALLSGALLRYVPAIGEGWTFRAITDAGGVDIATSGAFNEAPRLLVDDTQVGRLFSGSTLRIGARPTKPDPKRA